MKRVFPFLAVVLVFGASLAGVLWQINGVLQGLFALTSDKVWKSGVVLVAIGLLTMALIQGARSLFPLRGWFHRRQIELWLNGDTGLTVLYRRLRIEKYDTAFYDLPIQNICGQIAAVAETILVECTDSSQPCGEENLGLLRALAGPESKDDVDKLTAINMLPGDELSLRRARLGSNIQRNIDNLQITAGTRWRRRLRVSAFILSFLFSAYLLRSLRFNWHLFVLLGGAMVAGLIGGYFASVFRDLVAVIEGLRRQ